MEERGGVFDAAAEGGREGGGGSFQVTFEVIVAEKRNVVRSFGITRRS